MCYRLDAECVLHFSNTRASYPLVGGKTARTDASWSVEAQLERRVEIQSEVSPLDKGKGHEKDGERQQGIKERRYNKQNHRV